MSKVNLYSWNPRRPIMRGPVGRILPIRRRLNNFGDVLGPALVARLLKTEGIPFDGMGAETTLYSIGSVLHMVRGDDHVWGSGVNGKEVEREHDVQTARFHAVRGRLTKSFLEERGAKVPDVFGDPGILTSIYFPQRDLPKPLFRSEVTIVPNLHDYRRYAHLPNVLNPRRPLSECLATIATSNFVVGSSLHGLIVAESYGIPARRVKSAAEPDFKYADYYSGTGREDQTAATTIDEAIDLGEPKQPVFDVDSLVAAFPRFLWTGDDWDDEA